MAHAYLDSCTCPGCAVTRIAAKTQDVTDEALRVRDLQPPGPDHPYDLGSENYDRADLGAAMLDTGLNETRDANEQGQDAIANILHALNRENADPVLAFRMAWHHFTEEAEFNPECLCPICKTESGALVRAKAQSEKLGRIG